MFELEVHRFSRICARTGRTLEPGETYYSTVALDQGHLVRRDYAAEAWDGPPEGILGWWRARVPDPKATRPRLAPNDVLLNYFEQLQQIPDQRDTRYVLALLLLRRRILREVQEEADATGQRWLTVYCPSREESYSLPVHEPAAERLPAIQAELSQLLDADGGP